jgi:hypothetical protein
METHAILLVLLYWSVRLLKLVDGYFDGRQSASVSMDYITQLQSPTPHPPS